jgi:tetratricopeptide (TPR) repeat protein
MRSDLSQQEPFSALRRLLRKHLFGIGIIVLLIYLGIRLSQLAPFFYTPFPQAILPLTLYELGYFEQAANRYRAAYQQAGMNWEDSEDPLRGALLSGDFDRAMRTAKAQLGENPDDLRALKALATVAYRENDLQSAGKLSRQVLSLNEDDTDALVLTTLIATRHQSYDEAIRLLNRALRTGETGTVLTLLNVLELVGQLRDAHDPPVCLLAHFYRFLRMYDRAKGQWAVRSAEHAIAAGDHPAAAYVTIGIIQEKEGLLQRALETFQKAIQKDPSYGMAYRWAAGVYEKAGDHSHEYLMRRAAFETDPSDHLFREDLYHTLTERKEFRPLVRAMQQAIAHDAGDLVAYNHAAFALKQLGDDDQARHYLHRAIPLEPHSPHAYDIKAWMLLELGRHAEAEPLLMKSIQIDAERPQPHRVLAHLRYRQGDQEGAFVAYEPALVLGGSDEGSRVLEFCATYEHRDQAFAEACRARLFGRPR